MKAPKKKPKSAGRVAFLARADDIRAMVEAGHALFTIYQQHEGRLGISYSQFTRYVARYITHKQQHEKAEANTPALPVIEQSSQTTASGAQGAIGTKEESAQPATKPTRPPKPGFTHSATSGNTRKDLI